MSNMDGYEFLTILRQRGFYKAYTMYYASGKSESKEE
jgi:hypothetical protein